MSWLLFLDESGYDHKTTPYEVRGGICLHASRLWPFVQAMHRLELECFGCRLSLYGKELKGSTLLDKKRIKFACQQETMEDESRRKNARSFLTKGLEKKKPNLEEFSAYGQSCLEMARGVMQLLYDSEAVIFAAAIPRNTVKPPTIQAEEYLRKDQVFLFERFFYFLEEKKDHGLIVFDETDKTSDQQFVERIERYFTKTANGRYRTSWIVPAPFFVSSDMALPIQAADICIYCINWGFRIPSMQATSRPEISAEFGPWLHKLQYHGKGRHDNEVYDLYGIFYVPNPYQSKFAQ